MSHRRAHAQQETELMNTAPSHAPPPAYNTHAPPPPPAYVAHAPDDTNIAPAYTADPSLPPGPAISNELPIAEPSSLSARLALTSSPASATTTNGIQTPGDLEANLQRSTTSTRSRPPSCVISMGRIILCLAIFGGVVYGIRRGFQAYSNGYY